MQKSGKVVSIGEFKAQKANTADARSAGAPIDGIIGPDGMFKFDFYDIDEMPDGQLFYGPRATKALKPFLRQFGFTELPSSNPELKLQDYSFSTPFYVENRINKTLSKLWTTLSGWFCCR